MMPLVATSGEAAAKNTLDELKNNTTLDNFDPLMSMHWNICSNVMEKLGQSALYLLSGGPEDPIDLARIPDPATRERYTGRTWPRCPLCYINIAHEFQCADPACTLSRVDGYDVAIEWSADGAQELLKDLMKTVKES